MHVGALQFEPAFGRRDENLRTVHGLLKPMASRLDLVVLPELYSSGYNFTELAEAEAAAEDLEGPSIRALREWAREFDCALAAGFAERLDNRLFNSAILVDRKGEIRSVYRKLHLFDRETLFFSPGESPLEVVEVDGLRCGLMVCYDWRYPEVARTLALRGADIILHPSNLVLPWCPDAMLIRNLENKIYSITANRIGSEDRGGNALHFIGRSQVASPNGERLVCLGEEEVGICHTEIDPIPCRDKSVLSHNHLWKDLRPEYYQASLERES